MQLQFYNTVAYLNDSILIKQDMKQWREGKAHQEKNIKNRAICIHIITLRKVFIYTSNLVNDMWGLVIHVIGIR
jgi:hypothetical protein